MQWVKWLRLCVLDTYSNSETIISCVQAEVGASVPWEASRGEPVPGMEIRNGVPALWEDEPGSKVDCEPHGS